MALRISGLASGMNTDDIVANLMKAHRIPLDKLNQKKQTIEWQRDSYREVNNKFLELRNMTLQMKLESTYMAKKADSENDAAVSVSAGTSATPGNYTFQVTQLAEAASLTSSSNVGANNASATMSSINLSANTTLTITGSKGSATIDVKTTDTISKFVSEFNSKANVTGVRVSYDDTLDRFFFASSTTGDNSKIDLKSSDATLMSNVLQLTGSATAVEKGQTVTNTRKFEDGIVETINKDLTAAQTFRITYNGENHDFTVKKDTTIGSLIHSINSSALGKAGVSAYLDTDGKLAFFNPDDTKSLAFADQTVDSNNMITSLGLDTPTTVSNIAYTKLVDNGLNAQVKFNGIDGSYESNNFAINGISFTVKKLQTTDINISVSQNTDGVFESIKTFIDLYNETIGLVNGKLSEKRNRDFPPLTEEQKKDMSEEEIKLWEEKAKSGTLRSDPLLYNTLYSFRNALYNPVDGLANGAFKHLSDIGITTGPYLEQGKLNINEDKLRKAIVENPEQIMRLFNADDDSSTTTNGDGLITRVQNQIIGVMGQINSKAGLVGSTNESHLLGEELDDLDKDIFDFERRMLELENRYYQQFTAMEKYISQMDSQSSWLSQQFQGS